MNTSRNQMSASNRFSIARIQSEIDQNEQLDAQTIAEVLALDSDVQTLKTKTQNILADVSGTKLTKNVEISNGTQIATLATQADSSLLVN